MRISGGVRGGGREVSNCRHPTPRPDCKRAAKCRRALRNRYSTRIEAAVDRLNNKNNCRNIRATSVLPRKTLRIRIHTNYPAKATEFQKPEIMKSRTNPRDACATRPEAASRIRMYTKRSKKQNAPGSQEMSTKTCAEYLNQSDSSAKNISWCGISIYPARPAILKLMTQFTTELRTDCYFKNNKI